MTRNPERTEEERIAKMGMVKLKKTMPKSQPIPPTPPSPDKIYSITIESDENPQSSTPASFEDVEKLIGQQWTNHMRTEKTLPFTISSSSDDVMPEYRYKITVSLLDLTTTHNEPTEHHTILTRPRVEEAESGDDGDLQPSEIEQGLPVSDECIETPMGTPTTGAPGPVVLTDGTDNDEHTRPITNRTDSVSINTIDQE